MMNMDSLCKNVCLIGIIHIVGNIIFAVNPLIEGMFIINSYGIDENWSSKEAFLVFGRAVCFILTAILACLMVRGVVKQRHLLMAPFLIISTIGVSLLILLFLMRVIYEYRSCNLYEDCLYPIGVQVMILYPVYTLFFKLRYKFLKEKTLEDKSFKQEQANHVLTENLCV